VHQNRRRIRCAPPGDIDTHSPKGPDHLSKAHAETVAIRKRLRQRTPVELGDAGGRQFQRAAIPGWNPGGGRREVLASDPQPAAVQSPPVEFASVCHKSDIATPANVADNFGDCRIDPRDRTAVPPCAHYRHELAELRRAGLEDSWLQGAAFSLST